MRSIISNMIITIFALIMASACLADLITPEQAKQAVRTFEGDPYLEFCRIWLDRNTSLPEWAQKDQYYLLHADYYSGISRSWTVDAVTGEIDGAFYGDAFPPDEVSSDEPFGPLTEEECRQIAESFAQTHYSGFGVLNLCTNPNGEWISTGWSFDWWEELPSGAATTNGVTVEVSPIDGRIQSYESNRIPTPVHPDPQLSAEQAIAAAAQAVGIVNLKWQDGPHLQANPEQLFWICMVGGEDADGNGQLCMVEIDAITGDIISISVPNAGPTIVDLLADDQPSPKKSSLVWIRNLTDDTPDVSVHWLGKEGAKLIVEGKTYIIKPGSRTVKTDQSSITLSSTPELKDGKLMVPVDLLDMITALQKEKPETR